MNTRLLKLATRYPQGTMRWTVPGFDNGVVYHPEGLFTGWGASLSWPALRNGEEERRSVDLARHRRLARVCIRDMLQEVVDEPEQVCA